MAKDKSLILKNSYQYKGFSRQSPTVLVIMGITGDLARSKLIPAIFRLFQAGVLPKKFSLVGFSRRSLSRNEFEILISESLSRLKYGPKDFQSFLKQASYVQGDFDKPSAYKNLSLHLINLGEGSEGKGKIPQTILYLATPPSIYELILSHLAKSDLIKRSILGWPRILVEKPFGRDTKTATKLDELLGRMFSETQIFRIDHYLAKETIQNIMTFRFSNSIFEPIWNCRHIEKVEIRLLEKNDLSSRGNFYHDVGALRDVGQNHLLQMLALVAMEDPVSFSAKAVRGARANVLKELKPISKPRSTGSVTRGQYQGFLKEVGVPGNSQTETYFKIKAFIDNARWRGVPFYLESGKGMASSVVDIKIYFKSKAVCFAGAGGEDSCGNSLVFKIQPDEGIGITFWAKKPGLGIVPETRTLSFNYGDEKTLFDAYDRVLRDAIAGDQTLFASTEEVKAAWQFITPILDWWQKVPLLGYKKGSGGPERQLD